MTGRRPALEREALQLVTKIAELTGADPAEVMATGAGYKGATRTKLNPATMSDDRLMATVLDLRDTAKHEQAKADKINRLDEARSRP